RRRSRRRGVQCVPSLQDQTEIFVHQSDGKLRPVIRAFRCCQLSHVRRCDYGGLSEYFKQPLAIEATCLAESDSLRDCLHTDSEKSVHDQLHACSRSGWSHQEVPHCERSENRLCCLEHFSITTNEENEGAALDRRSAARDRNVHNLNTAVSAQGV